MLKIWAHTSEILGKKDIPSLENLSNSSLYFQDLTLSKRVIFLFPQVLKLIGPEFTNQEDTKLNGCDITKCRTISKSWSKTVDQYINDGTPKPDFFNRNHPQSSDNALVNAKYQYFGYMKPTKLSEFLTHFQHTHLPHSSRNPFVATVVYIDLVGHTEPTQWASIADQTSTLLRKYGQHIRILHLGLFKYHDDPNIQLQNHSWLSEWLHSCPNLTHLKVSGRFNLNDEMDVAFGSRSDPGEVSTSGRMDLDLGLPARFEEVLNRNNVLLQQIQCDYRIEDWERRNADLQERLNIMERLNYIVELPLNFLEPNLNADNDNHRDGIRVNHLQVHDFLNLQQDRQAIRPNLVSMPTFKNLQCLKLIQLSARNFNSIISANTQVTWLEIEPLNVEKGKYIDYLALEFPNLKKLYIKLCTREDFKKLKNTHRSWLSLTHLHFEYCASDICSFGNEFTEWVEIFKLISQNWGNTLTNLKLRLPVARTEKEKVTVARDSEICRLHLPNLKRLKIWLSDKSGERVAKMDFLGLIREQLELLITE